MTTPQSTAASPAGAPAQGLSSLYPTTLRCRLFGHRWDDFGGDRFLCTRLGCHHERTAPTSPAAGTTGEAAQ